MERLNVNFTGIKLSASHTRAHISRVTISAEKVNDRFRVMRVHSGRYLIFFGEGQPQEGEDPPPYPIGNQLTESDDGRVRMIDGKKYTVAGSGGRATMVPPRAGVQVLASPAPRGTHQITANTPIGTATIRKLGTRYQVFVLDARYINFFADQEVGPGFPNVTLKNELTLADAHSKKIIDGVEYTVAVHGGEMKIEPRWFEGTHPLN